MAPDRMNACWVRAFLALIALTGLLALGGCGGGSGAPNNPFAPKPPAITPVVVLPAAATVYSHTPATLEVSGGVAPYQAFSSNSALLPVPQAVNGATVVLLANDAATTTTVGITVQDSVGQTATATITVTPAPLLSGMTIVPARTSCGANTVCTGDTATATVTVTAPGGAGIPNRQVRFDVVTGAFAIESSNPAQPLVATQTVVSDANGNASVILQAAVNAPTQPAELRATELTTQNSIIGVFTIVQATDGTAILSVVPSTATVTGKDSATCSSGFRTDYFIYGGTPPYHVSPSAPGAITLVNSVVNVPGGFFEAITNGTCVNPLTFTIVDASGRQITAQLINQLGTTAPPTPPVAPALVVTPGQYDYSSTTCTGQISNFVITGGTAPYNVFFATTPNAGATITPTVVASAGMGFAVSGLLDVINGGQAQTNVTVVDSSSPQMVQVATITCPGKTAAPALVVTPGSYTYTAATCASKTSNFVITGGTPPYNVFFATPPNAGASITPSTVTSAGMGFAVSGLNQPQTNITVVDSSSPQKLQVLTIACP